MKTVYTIDHDRVLIGNRTADIDQMEPTRIVLMRNEVAIEPLPARAGYAVRYNEVKNTWEYVEDHRGDIVFDPITGKQVTIKVVGPITPYATQPKPSSLHEWNGKEWTITPADQAILDNEALLAEKAKALATVKTLHDEADKELATLQYRIDLNRANPEHIARMQILKGFVIDIDEWAHPQPIPSKP